MLQPAEKHFARYASSAGEVFSFNSKIKLSVLVRATLLFLFYIKKFSYIVGYVKSIITYSVA